MKGYKQYMAVSVLFFVLNLLAGCWSYRELDEMAIVAGMAVDKSENRYKITTEIAEPKQNAEGTQIESVVLEGEGRAVFDAVRNIIRVSGKKLFWSHAKTMIISEDLAKENIMPVLDWVHRDEEVRSDMYIVISKEKTGGEMLKGPKTLYELLSFQIQDTLRAEEHLSRFPTVEMWEFLNDLQEEGSGATAAGVYLRGHNGDKIPQVSGSALFKKNKMVGWLDDIETRAMLWVRDEINGGLIMVESLENEDTQVVLELIKSTTKLEPVHENGKLKMNINITVDMKVGEINSSKDYLTEQGIKEMEKATEEVIEQQIGDTIRKVQHQYNTDVFRFSQTIRQKIPKLWKDIREDWEEIFPRLPVQINIKVNIKGTALTQKIIRIGD